MCQAALSDCGGRVACCDSERARAGSGIQLLLASDSDSEGRRQGSADDAAQRRCSQGDVGRRGATRWVVSRVTYIRILYAYLGMCILVSFLCTQKGMESLPKYSLLPLAVG